MKKYLDTHLLAGSFEFFPWEIFGVFFWRKGVGMLPQTNSVLYPMAQRGDELSVIVFSGG